jgi:hypothetical protein
MNHSWRQVDSAFGLPINLWIADQSNRHSLGEGGGSGSSSCSKSSHAWAGKLTSSVNQWFRSTILHRIEQNGIDGEWMSAGKCF